MATTRKLRSLGDVERALAKLAHRVDRNGFDVQAANCLRAIYGEIAKIKMDRRDSHYKKRLRVLWQAHQKPKVPAPPSEPPQEH